MRLSILPAKDNTSRESARTPKCCRPPLAWVVLQSAVPATRFDAGPYAVLRLPQKIQSSALPRNAHATLQSTALAMHISALVRLAPICRAVMTLGVRPCKVLRLPRNLHVALQSTAPATQISVSAETLQCCACHENVRPPKVRRLPRNLLKALCLSLKVSLPRAQNVQSTEPVTKSNFHAFTTRVQK